MDIFKLLGRLEIEEEKRPLPATAYKLYVTLIIKANKLYWDGPLYFSHRRLAAIVGVSRNALSSAVQELVNRNLITYKRGKKDHSVSKFWFPDLPDEKHTTGSKNEPDSEPDVEPVREPVREPDTEPDRKPIYKTKYKQKQNIYDSDKNFSNHLKKKRFLDFVLLTDEEYKKLIDRYGKTIIDEYIEKLNNYIGSKGKRYKSHYHTLLNWLKKDKIEELPPVKETPLKPIEEGDEKYEITAPELQIFKPK